MTCDTTNSFVTTINLNSASLSGSLPLSFNLLSHLQSLSLQKNSLSGSFPSFQNISSLQSLYLDNNGFSAVPDNFLLGLPNLVTLTISENSNLAPWKIPNYLTECSNLVTFYANNASLTGAIPDIFASFF
ncbi:hypothetical protein C2S52_016981 [Perilla frutescens var. hirtella]|nr:hypothetical protein C2S52_016981 [Perilla frutescens var. hirtella]